MEILRPLMIRRIQNPQMKRMAIPAMRTLPRREIQRRTMRRRMTVMEILRPLMIRRIQNPQMKRMAIPAMRMLPISLVLLTMEMQIQRIRIHQRILEILTNQTTQMALAALIQRIHRHVPTYPLLLVRLLDRWRMPFCRINS